MLTNQEVGKVEAAVVGEAEEAVAKGQVVVAEPQPALVRLAEGRNVWHRRSVDVSVRAETMWGFSVAPA